MPQGNPWGEWDAVCQGCKRLIAPGQKVEQIRFDPDPSSEHELDEMNGACHAECDGPILSVKRALDAVSRLPF